MPSDSFDSSSKLLSDSTLPASNPRPSPLTPEVTAPTSLQRTIYSSLRPPPFPTNSALWPKLARQAVPAPNFGYVHDSAGTGSTCLANVDAFNQYRLKPRMLVDATHRDLSVTLFGQTYASPLLVAPVGVQEIMHTDAEIATAEACRNVKVPMILSTAATRTIEEVASASGDGDRWYQLYWPRSEYEDVTASLLGRAKREGYKVLVVTLDTFTIGWRPVDLDTSYLPFLWGQGCAVGFSDPVFQRRVEEELGRDERGVGEKLREVRDLLLRPGTPWGALKVLRNLRVMQRSQMWLSVMNSGTYRKWEDLRVLRELWGDGPIVLKGIQTVEDAQRAVEFGMDGIIVSNHGGRQLNGAIASLDALRDVCADETVKRSGLTVLFDSGVRTGVDVLKAMCLGAKGVLIGRPYMYGLAMGGQSGVEHVLNCLLAEVDNSLGQMGKRSVKDLSRGDLEMRKQQAKL
ncbi:hypothetical protein PMZ80_008270 [Knufia obscura]|uniref:FMN hydroxy acid dehydrogenase domain-containing protein n=2 Tax=Knufia TaxID=430999 RepID=A0AAN8I875_9EURO|nr:hypothetical protein PMZ80_008270 [Knufia obscura]KAK5957004.1 hypothetical protein OHC33_001373 [Knufia fluminis]